LEHRIEGGGRYHAFVSPDLKGFYVVSDTLAKAQREAIAVLDLIAEHRGLEKPEVEFVGQMAA
jgi:predicted RNase H-like HicB family nuclease